MNIYVYVYVYVICMNTMHTCDIYACMYINMVDYQQIILRCPTLVFENCSMDNIQDKNNFNAVSDILYWINKQDVEPFKMINYKNEDCGTVYSYNVLNKNFSTLKFKLVKKMKSSRNSFFVIF